ncbi:hypothetical protein [Staphylococcus equorum]|nr:hypothetical protein [Staphylococcus equorum]
MSDSFDSKQSDKNERLGMPEKLTFGIGDFEQIIVGPLLHLL